MRRRVWSARAARHLTEIHTYISYQNPAAADRVLARIIKATVRLERYPFSARIGVVSGTRELLVSGLPYVVIYAVTGDSIEIHGVFHTARDVGSRGFHET